MEMLISAYLIGWAVIAAYVGWLGMHNARLARRLEDIQSLVEEQRKEAGDLSSAA